MFNTFSDKKKTQKTKHLSNFYYYTKKLVCFMEWKTELLVILYKD